MTHLKDTLSIALLYLVSVAAFAQQTETIGRVLVSTGNVSSQRQNNNTLSSTPLRRGDPVFAGDIITTAVKAFVQLRLIDGAIISIRDNSEFSFREYSFDGDPDTLDQVILNLVQGGLKTITGSISDEENDTYLLTTPDVDIGVNGTGNGTIYECAIEPGITYCGVFNGGITVSNDTGRADLGLGGDWDYIKAENRHMPLVPLLRQPAQLANQSITSTFTGTAQAAPSPRQNLPGKTVFPTPEPIRLVPSKKP